MDNIVRFTSVGRRKESVARVVMMLGKGSIKVNGEVESRIRRKLRSGDLVEFGEHRISIVA